MTLYVRASTLVCVSEPVSRAPCVVPVSDHILVVLKVGLPVPYNVPDNVLNNKTVKPRKTKQKNVRKTTAKCSMLILQNAPMGAFCNASILHSTVGNISKI